MSSRKMLIHYLSGFGLSLIITLAAYVLVVGDLANELPLLLALGGLALLQMMVQLYFFLHLGEEMKPRLRLLALSFMALILVIIAGGSLWIMYHLNRNMMDMRPEQKDDYMTIERDKGF